MKHFIPLIALVASLFICLTACQKESPATKQIRNISSNEEQLENGFAPRPIDQLTGLYDDIGSRTLYTGNIKDGVILVVAGVPSPKSMTAQDRYTLLCDYADLGSSGWQYVIKYDPNTGTWDVQPNDVMAASITPGSFKVLEKQFSKREKRFYLRTLYTNSAGDDRLVQETLVHQ